MFGLNKLIKRVSNNEGNYMLMLERVKSLESEVYKLKNPR